MRRHITFIAMPETRSTPPPPACWSHSSRARDGLSAGQHSRTYRSGPATAPGRRCRASAPVRCSIQRRSATRSGTPQTHWPQPPEQHHHGYQGSNPAGSVRVPLPGTPAPRMGGSLPSRYRTFPCSAAGRPSLANLRAASILRLGKTQTTRCHQSNSNLATRPPTSHDNRGPGPEPFLRTKSDSHSLPADGHGYGRCRNRTNDPSEVRTNDRGVFPGTAISSKDHDGSLRAAYTPKHLRVR